MQTHDQNYLRNDQYKTATKLTSRIDLHLAYSTNPCGWFRWVFDQLALPHEAKILEIACGSGDLWAMNMNRVPPKWDIILTDLSEGMLAETRRQLAQKPRTFKFSQADIQSIPFADGQFDAVIANHMLYYVREKPRAFREVLRALKPGGSFFTTTVGERHMQELADLTRPFRPKGQRPIFDSRSLDFLLENGREQLQPFFVEIELRRYEDTLLVTQADPLIRYIYSEKTNETLQGRDVTLRGLIEAQIRERGGFSIFKDSGIFIARKGR